MVDVEFNVKENGKSVPSQNAANTLNYLSNTGLEKQLGYSVSGVYIYWTVNLVNKTFSVYLLTCFSGSVGGMCFICFQRVQRSCSKQ